MYTVKEIISQANPDAVSVFYKEHYAYDAECWGTPNNFRKFADLLDKTIIVNDKVFEYIEISLFKILFEYSESFIKKHPSTPEVEEGFDVSGYGRPEEDMDQRFIDARCTTSEISGDILIPYAVDFAKWETIKGLPVKCTYRNTEYRRNQDPVIVEERALNMSIDEMATHLFYEMTWHGWPEQRDERFDEISDSMEEFERHREAGTLDQITIPIDDAFWNSRKDKDKDEDK